MLIKTSDTVYKISINLNEILGMFYKISNIVYRISQLINI